MKNRKMRLIIGMLIGLVIFASSVALLLYTKIGKQEAKNVSSVEVYVATRHISRGDMIEADDLLKASLPKSYLSFTPLTATEIIGRYATVDIFSKEPMRKEKLSILEPLNETQNVKVKEIVDTESTELVTESITPDTITVSLSLFKNIDSSLKKGDLIDIVSVISKRNNTTKYKTKYVALSVRIHSFVSNYNEMNTYVVHGEESRTIASSVVFEMDPNDVKNFLSVYYETQELNAKRVFSNKENRGHLWMVKCSTTEDKRSERAKERMMIDHKQKVIKRKHKQRKNQVSISYE